jgi:hypothetical protein
VFVLWNQKKDCIWFRRELNFSNAENKLIEKKEIDLEQHTCLVRTELKSISKDNEAANSRIRECDTKEYQLCKSLKIQCK